MSRIGNKVIDIPSGVTVECQNGEIIVKGSKGELKQDYDKRIVITVKDSQVSIENNSKLKELKAKHGLYRALIANMILGVSEGFEKDLELVGVGYRVQLNGNKLALSLGYSHSIDFEAPEGVKFEVDGQTKIKVYGISKQAVGQVAANIRELRPPEPYKGKGVKYADERIIKKQGKSVK
jgi:large subunit ribosomal protein L6